MNVVLYLINLLNVFLFFFIVFFLQIFTIITLHALGYLFRWYWWRSIILIFFMFFFVFFLLLVILLRGIGTSIRLSMSRQLRTSCANNWRSWFNLLFLSPKSLTKIGLHLRLLKGLNFFRLRFNNNFYISCIIICKHKSICRIWAFCILREIKISLIYIFFLWITFVNLKSRLIKSKLKEVFTGFGTYSSFYRSNSRTVFIWKRSLKIHL